MQRGAGMYKYDAALSYESESQDFVREISDILTAEGWNVFFALDRRKELLSKNLKSELYQIYQNDSLVKVLFVTDKYLQSEYTMLEKRRSLSSACENAERLIVVNFMGEKLPKELKPFVYLEGNSFPDEIAFWVSERIKALKTGKLVMKKEEDAKRIAERQSINIVTNNGGYIFGDNANLSNVSFENFRR